MQFEEKTIHRETIFTGHIFEVAVDDVELSNGLGQAKRELVFHKGAVAILAITPENKLILVKQYRKAIEAISYEIPAGKIEQGEAGAEKEAAARELEEETGYRGQLTLIHEFYTAIGFSNEKIHLFLGNQLQKVEHPRPMDADETIELLAVSLEEALAMIADGRIQDAKTIIAIQYYQLYGGNHALIK